MVDGDFKKFEGKWSVKPGRRSTTAILSYEVNVIPNFNIPAIVMERIIQCDLPVNLQAIARISERSFEGDENTSTKVHSGAPYVASTTLDIDGTIEKNIPDVASKPTAEVNNKWGVFGKTCDIDKCICSCLTCALRAHGYTRTLLTKCRRTLKESRLMLLESVDRERERGKGWKKYPGSSYS